MRTVVVTGGGRGIGRAIALALAEPGGHVVVTGRTVAQLDATAAELHARGAEATAIPMDVADEANARPCVRRPPRPHQARRRARQQRGSRRRRGGSGIGHRALEAHHRHEPDRDVSRDAPILPLMREGGRVINMSSVLGRFGVAEYHGLLRLEARRHRLYARARAGTGRTPVTVNALSPGWVQTDWPPTGCRWEPTASGLSFDRVQGARDCRRANQAHDRSRRGGGAGPIPLQCRSQRDHRADLQHLRRANDGLNKVPGARCRVPIVRVPTVLNVQRLVMSACAVIVVIAAAHLSLPAASRADQPPLKLRRSAEAFAKAEALAKAEARAFQGASGGGRNPFAGEGNAVAAGQRLFDQNCQSCHGPGGRGDSGPALNTGSFGRGDAELFRTIQEGVAGSQMPPFRQLSDNQLWQLVTYLRSLAAAPTDLRRPVVVARTRDGREIQGVRVNEDTFTLQLMDASGRFHLLDKLTLADMRVESTLVLPGNYLGAAPRSGVSFDRLVNAAAEPHNWLMYLGRLPRHPLLGARRRSTRRTCNGFRPRGRFRCRAIRCCKRRRS